MTWRNYPHLAARAFNQPLLLEPAYARVFFSVLGERFGANKMVDAVTGEAYAGDELKKMAFGWGEDTGGRKIKSYRIENGIAVLPVSGTLLHKFGAMQPLSGMTGYDGIVARMQQAINDPDVNGILLDIDSPGGEVAGAFDTADLIYRMRDQKPVWAIASDEACSAGYLLASACSRRLITQTGVMGSIGVIVAHKSIEKAMEKAGVDITLIYSGSHKADANPFEKLPSDVRDSIQIRVDESREMFASKVASYSGLSKEAVLATEAAMYEGAEAVKVGLAHQVVNYADAVSVMAESIKQRGKIMTGTTKTAEATGGTGAEMNMPEVEATPAVDTTAAATAQANAAATDEMTRIMSIIECDEATGREPLAKALAKMPGMSLEAAKVALLASPVGAQAKTETALDAMMKQESPEAVATGEAQNKQESPKMAALRKAAARLTGVTQ